MINLFKKLLPRTQRAQNLSEYSLLLALIMGSIIIAGPYVIRSVNANLKGWDDSIQDSVNDPLIQAPPDVVTIPGCDCSGWTAAQCGPVTTPSGFSCPVFQLLQTRSAPQDATRRNAVSLTQHPLAAIH